MKIQMDLPDELLGKLEKRSKQHNFAKTDEYIVFVLQEVVKQLEPQPTMSEADEEKVKERLKNLGYLD
jgi:metal-responsive CopG/Arc/MetJ family transcriptional regulator